MHSYMDYIVRCFDTSNQWDHTNVYPAMVATPKAILDFPIPQASKVDINKKSSSHSANSLTLSNIGAINGSIAYFYSLAPLCNVVGSSEILLQDAVNTYQFVDLINNKSYNNNNNNNYNNKNKNKNKNNATLLYGKLNFPSNILEGLVIKNFSQNSRILMKCLSTNSNLLKNHGILTVYFQQNYPKYSLEYIYSSNENLVGFRNLYNFNLGLTIDTSFETINNDDDLSSPSNKIFYDNSRLSIGTEIWYGISNMTPGISNSIRYSTYSTYTGKPLTITLSCNPLIGLLSSTYTVKTSVNSTLCSKYDFNVYSYESDVSFGCELWNFRKRPLNEEISRILDTDDHATQSFQKLMKSKNLPNAVTNPLGNVDPSRGSSSGKPANNISNIEKFKDLYRTIGFLSVFKLATLLNNHTINMLWEGKWNDFLVTVGCNFVPFSSSEEEPGLKSSASSASSSSSSSSGETKKPVSFRGPDITKFGISLQYSS